MVDLLKLTLLSHPVTVKFVDAEDSHDLFGLTDRDTLTIRISQGMSYSMTLGILLHELIHVGETILGHRFTEEQVQGLAAIFYSLFWDNEELRTMFDPNSVDEDGE